MKKLFLIFLLLSVPANADELLSKAVEKLIIDVHRLKESNLKLEAEIKRLSAEVERLKYMLSERKHTRVSSPTYSRSRTIRQNTHSKQNAVSQPTERKQVADELKVLRGRLVKSSSSCVLATVRTPSRKGAEELLSVLPEEAPLYLKRVRKMYVYLTLPEYCSKVRERIKDAYTARISIDGSDNSSSVVW